MTKNNCLDEARRFCEGRGGMFLFRENVQGLVRETWADVTSVSFLRLFHLVVFALLILQSRFECLLFFLANLFLHL